MSLDFLRKISKILIRIVKDEQEILMDTLNYNLQDQNLNLNWDRFTSCIMLEVKREEKVFNSSAVAIAKNILLTAAHSVDCYTNGIAIIDINGRKQKIKIKNCIIHPEYNPGNSFFENDIAIVILSKNLPKEVRLERISEKIHLRAGEILERVGFGGRDNKNIKTWSNPIYIEASFNRKNFTLEDDNSVVGDSGGPIFQNKNGELKLLGIHSTLECKNKTYIVNVSKYINWIDMNRDLRVI